MIQSMNGKKRRGPQRNRRDELLRRLGLTFEQVAGSLQIAPLLEQCDVFLERIIDALRADHLEPDSQRVIHVWDSLAPAERPMLGFDGLALACGLPPRRLWELYCGANMMQSRDIVSAMIADALPRIIRVTIKDAMKVKGVKSREHILKAARILPAPKGTVINLPQPPTFHHHHDLQ